MIYETLPLDLTTRRLASYNKANSKDCASYIQQVTTDQTQITNICSTYDFTDVDQLKAFVNATWYGDGYYLEKLQQDTTLTSDQTTKLFDATVTGSFGAAIVLQTTAISTKYTCAAAANCTAAELAGLQWGSAGVTLDPPVAGTEADSYMPVANSVKTWWSSEWPQITQEPEYYSYVNKGSSSGSPAPSIPAATVSVIAVNDTDLLGLNNNYNGARLAIAYGSKDETMLQQFTTAYGGYDASTLFEVMRYHVETYTMEGSFSTYSGTDDLINGYNNTIADKVNGGQYYGGYDFSLSPETTPVFNEMFGGVSKGIIGMYTGSLSLDSIGQVRILNDEAYVNKAQQVWNGTYFSEVPQNPDGTIGMEGAQMFKGAGNGMQFPPFVDTDSPVEVYDSRLVKIVEYSHSDDDHVDGSDVTLSKFRASQFGGDVGFAFSQDFFEQAYGCGDCTNNSTDTRIVKVDGSEYVFQSTLSDNYIQVQKESGYTYQTKKKSTVFVVLGGTLTGTPSQVTPFPSLDPYYGMMFPWYDLEENMVANDKDFLDHFNFIGESQTTVRRITISMSTFAAFFLILGIVAFILYKLKGDDEDEHSVHERDQLIKNHE